MVEKENLIIHTITEFYSLIKPHFPIKRIILYGSYSRGSAQPDSDIDVGVVLDLPDHLKRIELGARLFRYSLQVDPRIEPKVIFWDEYLDHEPASILGEICRTGMVVV